MSERFEIRMDSDLMSRLDNWRGEQDDRPSRSEAARRLLDHALAATASRALRFSDGEKLLLWMMGDLYKKLGVRGEINADFVTSALSDGHLWALKWELQGVFDADSDRDETVTEVVEILDMWSSIESGIASLKKSDIAAASKVLGRDVGEYRFPGFDGNNETEYLSVARFLIEKMDRFQEFKGRGLNSHHFTLSGYRRMLEVFLPIRAKLIGRSLTHEEIVRVLTKEAEVG